MCVDVTPEADTPHPATPPRGPGARVVVVVQRGDNR